jgi:hypothetical protein
MGRPWRRGGWVGLVLVVLAGGLLGGCDGGSPPVPVSPVPVSPPAVGQSDAELCGVKPFGAEQPPEAWVRFDITRAQLDLIHSRLIEVMCRQGLWRQGAGFGWNVNAEGTRYWVVIHPGRSGLTARQVLDRLLGRGP